MVARGLPNNSLSESFDWLRTNGDRIEISEKFPFMLSWVEAFRAFFQKRRKVSDI